ncbi:MAG: hypothetical protein Q4G21_07660 [Dermabacter sp.]|nr:hypothetical protein [Dermabacter sp.]
MVAPDSAAERRVCAMLLVSEKDGLEDLRRTLTAIAAQRRAPDELLVSVSEACGPEVTQLLEQARDSGLIEALVPTPAGTSLATLIARLEVERAHLAELPRPRDSRPAPAPLAELSEPREPGEPSATSDPVVRSEDPAAPSERADSAGQDGTGQRGARDFTLLTPAFGPDLHLPSVSEPEVTAAPEAHVVPGAPDEPETPAEPAVSAASEDSATSGPTLPPASSAAPARPRAPRLADSAAARGRRARDVNLADLAKEEDRLAKGAALVPERLRRGEEPTGSLGRRRRAIDADQQWLWILTARSAPSEEALAELLAALDATPSLALVGPKHLAVEDLDAPTSRIVDLGITLTPSNRVVTSVEPGEIDQGQADWRGDVLAVALPGILVRASTYERLGGMDPQLTSPWAEIDVSQRVWRAGERVRVVPSATVHAPLETADRTSSVDFRASQILTLLKFRSLPWALLTLLALPFIAAGRIIGAIVRHDGAAVLSEARATLRALVRGPGAIARARGERAEAVVGRRRLAPLYMPSVLAARERLDSWWTLVFSDDERSRRIRRTTWGISGSRHGIDDADYGRHTMWTLIVLGVSFAVSLVSLRSLTAGGPLAGGALVPPSVSPRDAFDAVFSSWIPAQLGAPGPSDAFARLMGHVPLEGSTILTLVVLGSIPIAALGAWIAAGTLTRSVLLRLIATLAWVGAPPFIAALAEGRWPLLLVHAALPYAAQCLARAVGLPHKVSQASVAAAAGGGLLVAAISTVQPMLGVALLAGVGIVALFVPGRRRRLWWFVIPTLAAHLPNLPGYVRWPETLLTVAGMPSVFERADAPRMLLLEPSAFDPLSAALGREPSLLTAALAAAPLIIAAIGMVVAAFLPHTVGLVARIALVASAGAYLFAFVCVNFVVGFDGEVAYPAYPGGALSLAAAAILAGGLCAGDALWRRAGRGTASARAGAITVGTLALGACLALAGIWTVLGPAALQIAPTATPVPPAVAADQGLSSERGRTLVLQQDATGAVTTTVVNGGGLSLDQVSAQVMAEGADAAERGMPYDAATGALASAVAQNVGASSTQSESPSLGRFAVAYVVVPGDIEAQASLIDALNRSPRFEQVTVSETGGMWRVVDPASRAWIEADGEERTPLSSERTAVEDDLAASTQERTIVLAERADPRWQASVDGRALDRAVVDGWAQGFVVPEGTEGHLRITYGTPFITALVVAGYVLVAVSALVAVPWRRRKDSSR